MPVIQLLWRWRQEDGEYEVSTAKVSEILSQKQNKSKRAELWLN
jgi:hypothetical protein